MAAGTDPNPPTTTASANTHQHHTNYHHLSQAEWNLGRLREKILNWST